MGEGESAWRTQIEEKRSKQRIRLFGLQLRRGLMILGTAIVVIFALVSMVDVVNTLNEWNGGNPSDLSMVGCVGGVPFSIFLICKTIPQAQRDAKTIKKLRDDISSLGLSIERTERAERLRIEREHQAEQLRVEREERENRVAALRNKMTSYKKYALDIIPFLKAIDSVSVDRNYSNMVEETIGHRKRIQMRAKELNDQAEALGLTEKLRI